MQHSKKINMLILAGMIGISGFYGINSVKAEQLDEVWEIVPSYNCNVEDNGWVNVSENPHSPDRMGPEEKISDYGKNIESKPKPEWKVNKLYAKDTIVTYKGIQYKAKCSNAFDRPDKVKNWRWEPLN
ncbi:hypothetical protein [Bacillus cereus]|uniref:hypothetical protein n=1 Tax=Bacillus cereus TaxID=1396 RepID=UPI0028529EDB|nr:hypothetical protein [Bacillus cereus]WLE91067.1 hypothetical protein GGBNIMDK_00098 [Bacillus cereus]